MEARHRRHTMTIEPIPQISTTITATTISQTGGPVFIYAPFWVGVGSVFAAPLNAC